MKKINASFIKRLPLIFFLASVMFIFQATNSFAQSSRGTDFWICFPGNFSTTGTRLLYITAETNSVVNINITNPAFATVVNVSAGTLTTVTLPNLVDISTNGIVENKGIHITSDNPVTVYGMNQQNASTDAFLALPVDALGTNYYVMAYSPSLGYPVQMTIVATENSTTVSVTPTVGAPVNVVLNQGQTYQLRTAAGDYTGSLVVSDKPVSVFGGNQCTQIPTGTLYCDHLVEQIPPTDSWGQSFVTVPLATRNAGDIFRIMAQQNATQVSINGGVVANLNAGQFYETSLASNSYNRITSDKPVLVGQYSKSTGADGVTSDPFFALVPPDEQFLANYVISAGTSNVPINFLNITSPTANTGTVLVDGAPVPPGSWTPIPSTSFSGAKVQVTSGIHTVSSTLPVGLLVYGFGNADSYGYLGGQAFGAVATITTLDLTPVNGTAQINTNQCWSALVENNFGDPVPGVRVDFTRTGANPGAGFAFTDANGIATYCYSGTTAGNDVIVANVGAINDTAQFEWTDQPSPAIPVSNWALFIGLFLIIALVVWRFRRA